MPCVTRLFFPLFTPLALGWAYLTQILIFLNAVNCNGCAHIRAIIFILTSNLGDPTPEFQRPLSHYVFKHRLVYLIAKIPDISAGKQVEISSLFAKNPMHHHD
jgi:hypothetical protein